MKKEFNDVKFFEEFEYNTVDGGLTRIKSERFSKPRPKKKKEDLMHRKQVRFNGDTYLEHRLVFYFHHRHFPEVIDHINGNFFDNRIENLRECTQLQNSYNRKKTKANRSGVKGVYWCRTYKIWKANLDSTHLGNFNSIEEAEEAIKKIREAKHKQFTNHG